MNVSKKKLEDYRPGAAGSLIDEYERAAFELKSLLQTIDAADYTRIVEGESDHCHSIAVIMNHVVRAGYGYANYIRNALLIDFAPVEDRKIKQSAIGDEIDQMLTYTAQIFDNRRQAGGDEMTDIYFKTRWNVTYNIDQLLEHAIVHILRHRRQIEKFLVKFAESD